MHPDEEEKQALADVLLFNAAMVERTDAQSTPHKIEEDLGMLGLDSLEVRDLLTLVAWTRDFKLLEEARLPSKLLKDDEIHAECDHLLATLTAEYQKRVKLQVSEWLERTSWQRHMEVFPNSEGRLVTAYSEDVTFAVRTQLSVSREYLPPAGCVEVMVDILVEMKTAQARMKESLDSDWTGMGIERLCSVVNDCSILYEICSDIFVLEGIFPSYELKKTRDEVSKGYLDLALQATMLMARSIVEDLREPVLAHVFSTEWEEGMEVVPICASTLRDYFGDVSIWLPQNFFCRIVRKCLVLVLEGYLEGAFSQHRKRFLFQNSKTVSALLLKDRLQFVEFFSSEYAEQLKMTGLREKKDVEEAFEIISAMSKIVCAEDAKEVPEDIFVLLRELGFSVGNGAVMYLVRRSRKKGRRQAKNWKDTVQSICEDKSAEMTQVRFDCDLFHLVKMKKPSKVRNTLRLARKVGSNTCVVWQCRKLSNSSSSERVGALLGSQRRQTSHSCCSQRNSGPLDPPQGEPPSQTLGSVKTASQPGRTDPKHQRALQKSTSIRKLVEADMGHLSTISEIPSPFAQSGEPECEQGSGTGSTTRGIIAKGKKKIGKIKRAMQDENNENDGYKFGDLSRGLVAHLAKIKASKH